MTFHVGPSRSATVDFGVGVDRGEVPALSLGELGVTGVVIANPLPQTVVLEDHRVEAWVNEAMTCSEALGVMGKSLTAFLLQRVAELSEGQSLKG